MKEIEGTHVRTCGRDELEEIRNFSREDEITGIVHRQNKQVLLYYKYIYSKASAFDRI